MSLIITYGSARIFLFKCGINVVYRELLLLCKCLPWQAQPLSLMPDTDTETGQGCVDTDEKQSVVSRQRT